MIIEADQKVIIQKFIRDYWCYPWLRQIKRLLFGQPQV